MTAAEQVPSKAELLAALRDSGEEAQAKLGALPAERFEDGRYEGGWNGRQILAHVASIEWTYPRLLDIANEGSPPTDDAPAPALRQDAKPAEDGNPTRIARGGILNYNERQVAKRVEATVAELLDEFRRNRAATIAAVEAVDDARLRTPITSAGGSSGALGQVLYGVAVHHVRGHIDDIVGPT